MTKTKKFLNKIVTLVLLLALTMTLGISHDLYKNTNSHNISLNQSNQSFENSNNIITSKNISTTCRQITRADGADLNTDFNGKCERNININQIFKKIFLAKNTQTISATNLVNNINVANANTNNCCGTCGGDYFYDYTKRIQDWSRGYSKNINLSVKEQFMSWGISQFKLGLYTSLLWPKRKNQSSLRGTVVFKKDNNQHYEYDTGKDLHFYVGSNRNLTNPSGDIYGMPYSFLKETPHVYILYNYVNRFWYELQPTSTLPAQLLAPNIYEININGDANSKLMGGLFDCNQMLAINDCNFQNKTIHIGINRDWFDFIVTLDAYHQKVKAAIDGALKGNNDNQIKMMFYKLVDRNLIDENNIQSLIPEIKFCTNLNLDSASSLVYKNSHSPMTETLIKHKMNPFDNPWPILNAIKNHLEFNVNYAVPNPAIPSAYQNHHINFNFDQLLKGIDINITPNNQNIYQFKIINVSTDEVDTPEFYIQNWQGDDLINNSQYLQKNLDGSYRILPAIINNVAFKESDDEFTKKHYLSDLSDTDIINRFVLLTDNYGNICNGEALDQKKYKIQRDPMKGTAVISININDQFYTHTYSGFKQANQQIANIDSTILRYNMIVDDLDQFQIKALLNASHQVSDIINQLHFTISSVQDQTQAKITIDQVSNPQMRDLYLYQSFLVTNLQPYYIKLKSHIEPNVLNRTPSTINTNLFRQKFLDISDEFCNRNNDTLLITLKVDKKSNTLIAKISWFEKTINNQKEITLYVTNFHAHANNTTIAIIIAFIIFAMGILGLGGYLIYQKKHSRKLTMPPE